MPLPLEGIRVFELGTVIAGPAVGLFLADLGADVVSIENPRADPYQQARPSTAFLRRNKRSLAINLAKPAGKDLFLDLIRTADVVVENYAPGAVDRIGVGYEAVSAVNSRIVYCSIKGFLPGPYSNRLAADELAQMMGGLAYMTGLPQRPMRAGASITDLGVAAFSTMAILAALLQRASTGRGQHIHGGLFETVAFWMSQHLAILGATGQTPEPITVRGVWEQMRWPIYDVFEVADKRQVFVGILNDKQWASFCAEFELDSLKSNPDLQTNEQRLRSRQLLLNHLGPLFLNYPIADLLARLERAEVLFAPVNRPEDLLSDAHLHATNQFLETEFKGRRFLLPALPLRSSAYRLGIRRQPAPPGEDTLALLNEYGYDRQRVAELSSQGVIGLPETPKEADK
jgi:crotonobetainyl-CoA:carnitine CoA-transferase CaiB-like acyl-CoA transferase